MIKSSFIKELCIFSLYVVDNILEDANRKPLCWKCMQQKCCDKIFTTYFLFKNYCKTYNKKSFRSLEDLESIASSSCSRLNLKSATRDRHQPRPLSSKLEPAAITTGSIRSFSGVGGSKNLGVSCGTGKLEENNGLPEVRIHCMVVRLSIVVVVVMTVVFLCIMKIFNYRMGRNDFGMSSALWHPIDIQHWMSDPHSHQSYSLLPNAGMCVAGVLLESKLMNGT